MTGRVVHEIAPVFDANSRILLLGSIPSPRSRETGFFYGHPGNRMWKVLARVFEEEVPDSPARRKAFLLRNGIAMWDVLASCEIEGASDASIKNEQPNDLSVILSAADIRAVFTTGARAAQFYKKYDEALFDIPHMRLPSTSPANAAMSLDRLTEAYQVLRTVRDGAVRRKG